MFFFKQFSNHHPLSTDKEYTGGIMFRSFDILVLLSALLSLFFSLYLFIVGDKQTALYVGIWVPSVLGFGIHIKLLRIVHFVLYKYLNGDDTKKDIK